MRRPPDLLVCDRRRSLEIALLPQVMRAGGLPFGFGCAPPRTRPWISGGRKRH